METKKVGHHLNGPEILKNILSGLKSIFQPEHSNNKKYLVLIVIKQTEAIVLETVILGCLTFMVDK